MTKKMSLNRQGRYMPRPIRAGSIIWILYLSVAMVILFSACSHDVNARTDMNGQTHFTGPLMLSGLQVWVQNKNTENLDDAYNIYANELDIEVYSYILLPDDDPLASQPFELVFLDEGKIKKGKLSIAIPELEDDYLLEWDDFSFLYFSEWCNISTPIVDPPAIFPAGVKGNVVNLWATEGLLNREGLVGTPYSVGMESILFMYVDYDCTISLGSGEGVLNGDSFSISNQQSLTLQKGWNTICKREAFGKSGRRDILLMQKNPDGLKWVMYPEIPLLIP